MKRTANDVTFVNFHVATPSLTLIGNPRVQRITRSVINHVNLKFATESLLGLVAEAFDGSQNLVCGLGPFEGLRVSVVQVDEDADVGLELPDGGVNTALDLLSGKFSEPALDLIDP